MWSHGQFQSWHGAGNLLIALYAEADPAAMFPSCLKSVGFSGPDAVLLRRWVKFSAMLNARQQVLLNFLLNI